MTSQLDSRNILIARAIARWFKAASRELPWRVMPRDPYLSLVSEFMLQQTQVARVLEKWEPFVRRFPDVASLAAASEDDVLALWSGLGYYRRARNLRAAAKQVVDQFNGAIPMDVASLQRLPGIGRYTAGAISSIAFNRAAPIVDGNVARVLMRLEGRPFRAGSADGGVWAWKRAETLIGIARKGRVSVAQVNEGLMELGAVVCTPRRPNCESCPVRKMCVAARSDRQDRIPLPKVAPGRKAMYCEVVVVQNRRGILVERRPVQGMWGGLWQAPTWERAEGDADARDIARWLGVPRVVRRDRFLHDTTHRRVHFRVWSAADAPDVNGRVFISKRRITLLGLSNPQRRILLGLQAGLRR
jgi:A/G-specific adenine glycosylase